MNALLNYDSLKTSLQNMERLFSKADFNSETFFGLLRASIMELPYLAHSLMFLGFKTYDETKEAVRDFEAGRGAFHTA